MYSNRFGVDVGSGAGVGVALGSGVGVARAAGAVAGVADTVEGALVAEAAGEAGREAGGVPMIARTMTPPTNTRATMTQPRKPPLFFLWLWRWRLRYRCWWWRGHARLLYSNL